MTTPKTGAELIAEEQKDHATEYRLQLSPHEWTWTNEEAAEMAREIFRLRDQKKAAERFLLEIKRFSLRSCHQEHLSHQALQALGFEPPSDMTIANALLAAEIDRLQRLEGKE